MKILKTSAAFFLGVIITITAYGYFESQIDNPKELVLGASDVKIAEILKNPNGYLSSQNITVRGAISDVYANQIFRLKDDETLLKNGLLVSLHEIDIPNSLQTGDKVVVIGTLEKQDSPNLLDQFVLKSNFLTILSTPPD